MIFTLSDTDTHEIARTLVEIRDDGSQGYDVAGVDVDCGGEGYG